MLKRLALFLLLVPCLLGGAEPREVRLASGWAFQEATAPSATPPPPQDPGWRAVTLPHGAFTGSRQGLCWYARTLPLRPEWQGRRVSLRFDGAMQRADVYVDGAFRFRHEGGYLPFFLDLSAEAARGGEARVAPLLDNRDLGDVPPGKPLKNLDFTYSGGLYRDVWVVVTDPLRITDAVEAGQVGGGGVRFRCLEATQARARLEVQVHVANGRSAPVRPRLRLELKDPEGQVAARGDLPLEVLAPGEARQALTALEVAEPRLWHPDHPWLYTLSVQVEAEGLPVDAVSLPVGLRTLAQDAMGGLRVNGEPFRIRGTNRHQDHPIVGNALPARAQARDARRLKAAGFNFLRLAHYPQSPAFLDACDRVGLFVAGCLPGWQWYPATAAFDAASERGLRELVRRDRNHPCLLYWETSLNETSRPPDALYRRYGAIAKEELPGSLVGGDTEGRWNPARVGYDLPYTGWDGFYQRTMPRSLRGRLGFHREYGDYEFGGEHSTTRMARGDGEEAQLLQAWNVVWSHNDNLGRPWTLGDASWVGIDHFRGCSEDEPISRCGALDSARLPKYVYHFFRSQRDPRLLRADVESGPVVFLATEWTPRPAPAKVVVFSNASEVELFLNGRSLGRRRPDAGPDAPYRVPIPDADPNYWKNARVVHEDAARPGAVRRIPKGVLDLIFDGGNATHLDHPPFTFTGLPFEPGELKAVAWLDGQPVATDVRRTPGAPEALVLALDEAGVPLAGDGSDLVWVRAELRDGKGGRVPVNGGPVTFRVEGEGELVGPAQAPLEAGLASILVRGTGRMRILAEAGALRGSLDAVPGPAQD